MSTMNNAAEMTMMNNEMTNANEKVLSRKKTSVYISLGALVTLVVAFACGDSMWGMGLLWLTMILAIVSYFLSGGVKNILSIAKKMAVFGWYVLPFPYDIATGMTLFMVTVMFFLWVPVIFVGYDYLKARKSM